MATAVAEKTVNPMESLRAQLERRSDELKRALPTHIPPERFIRVVQTAAQLNPDLLTVNRQSLWNACLRAAQDGLLPDAREGVILPYKDNNTRSPTNGQVIAQWQTMIYGILKRFRNSGQFKSISANIVHEHDVFEYWIDELGEHIKHVPSDHGGKAVKAYAVAVTKDGGSMVKVMSVADIEKRRAVSKAKDGPMWREWWDEAAMKTVLRNLAKRLPSSSDLDDLIRRDDELYSFDTAAERRGGVRPADVAGTLDHFSGASPKPDSEPSNISEPGSDEPQSESTPETVSASEEDRAEAAGVKAHNASISRKAVPPEYRTPENSHLAKAWLTGWDSVE
jgi:recombination protein RecT